MNNRAQIKLFFDTDFPLHKEGVEELIESFKVKEIPKNRPLLNENDYETTLRFINKGVVREFYRTDKKEININFYTSPQFITDFSSFMGGSKTNKNQESLSPVQILELGNNSLFRF